MKTKLHILAGLLAATAAASAAPGDLDPTFGSGGKVTTITDSDIFDRGNSVVVQSDGKIVVAGNAWNGSNYDFALVRYATTGARDTSFGGGTGKVITDIGIRQNYGRSVAVQSDGKIVVAGDSQNNSSNYDFALARYIATGALDTSFGGGTGKVTTAVGSSHDEGQSVAMQSDGKIVVAGYSQNGSSNNFALVRYTATGALDTSFGGGTGKVTTAVGSSAAGRSVAVQSDGKIVVAGNSYNGSNYQFALVRYTATGELDPTFGGGTGKVTTAIGSSTDSGNSVAVQSDGKIVVAGYSYNASGNADFALVRYTAIGDLDPGFGGGTGKVTTAIIGSSDDSGQGVAVQSNGKIVVAGYSEIVSNNYRFALVRYTATGALDTSFGGGTGKVTTFIGLGTDFGYSVALQSDGKIVVAGYSFGQTFDLALVRYLGDPPDADGDGLLDSWEITHFGSIAAHSALDDTDHDGRVELLEEAFGTDPLAPDAGAPVQAVVENGYLTMTIARRLGFAFTIQSAASPDASAFSAATTTVLLEDGSTLKVRDNFPIATNPQRYLRVKVTAAP